MKTVTQLEMTPRTSNPGSWRVIAFLLVPRPSRRQRFVAWLRKAVR